jgi:hypothetical protein
MAGENFQWLPLEEFERLTPRAKNAYLSRLAREIQQEIGDSARAGYRDAAQRASSGANRSSLKHSQRKRREWI